MMQSKLKRFINIIDHIFKNVFVKLILYQSHNTMLLAVVLRKFYSPINYMGSKRKTSLKQKGISRDA